MNQTDFFVQLCARMSWDPTPWRLGVFNFWANNEFADTDGNGNNQLFDNCFNPLATTRTGPNLHYKPLDLGFGPGNWNNVPVKNYLTFEDGLQATYETLQLSYYQNIRKCFTNQDGYPEAVGPNDFTSWVGSPAYGASVVQFMQTTTASKVMRATATLADIVTALGGEQAIADWNKRGNSLLAGYAIEQQKLADEIQARINQAVIEITINGVKVPLTK
jgi:hypothetical protein